jgi:hypothetical protein
MMWEDEEDEDKEDDGRFEQRETTIDFDINKCMENIDWTYSDDTQAHD